MHGFEISLNSRRFAVPRDSYSKIIDGAAYEEVNSAVVSVLIKDKWSDWLKDQLSTDTSTELTPETLTALREMASGNLIDEIRDTAICLGLGDKVRIDIKSQKEDGIDNALKKFGVDDIDELKRILRMTGLEIINTSDRLSDGESQSGYNSITEIDALLEAIHKSQKKRTTKRRKGWLKGAL